MHPPRTSWSTRRGLSALLAVLSAAALVVLGVQTPAQATPHQPAPLAAPAAGGHSDARNSPLTVIVAKDGYQPTVAKGDALVNDFTLKKA
ncbi:hypothetical protein ABZ883_39350 [Streptomyces sp. NPDC046977]|uniref:hypothetical protein n=1 Tax=Streptomyces sp. NPDC046977 TaxID=3154703 RepID=UPI0033D2A7FE